MYSYISLKVDCPLCGKSMMNTDNLVDNIPSIRLFLSSDGEEGTIFLSSFYGSYNHSSNIMIKNGVEYQFYCPNCNKKLQSGIKCEECSAEMIPLKIRDGGKIRFCSRSGCKNHNVEFVDLSHVYNYFQKNLHNDIVTIAQTKTERENNKEIINSGSFLRIYCPHCEKSLIEQNAVLFKVINQNDEVGFLMLNPYLNVFTNESTVFIPEGAVAKDIRCPFCEKSLIATDIKCDICGAPAVDVTVAAVWKMIDFYICSKKGCHWHNLSPEDLQHVVLEDSNEW
ncbi:MAG: class I tRNA ligase family protein [Candidatus Thorarchaeota archaeon]